MKKDLMKRVIIDVQNEGCPEAHIAPLLDCFESLMATPPVPPAAALITSWPT
jgi:hypothetical protein